MIKLVSHPAKYSKELLPILELELKDYNIILDPFAGTGRLREIRPDAFLLEIEPEWAEQNNATVGDALAMPWNDDYFDAVVTSPTYGNRMADHHNAKDASKRNTYTHTLGRRLHPNNSGQLQWGKEYRQFHYKAWQEVARVLKPGGRFILNISDHIRKGKRIKVSRFHRLLLQFMGFKWIRTWEVKTPRQKNGANANLRVEHEYIYVFEKE